MYDHITLETTWIAKFIENRFWKCLLQIVDRMSVEV